LKPLGLPLDLTDFTDNTVTYSDTVAPTVTITGRTPGGPRTATVVVPHRRESRHDPDGDRQARACRRTCGVQTLRADTPTPSQAQHCVPDGGLVQPTSDIRAGDFEN
jgi:hypothetical protein